MLPAPDHVPQPQALGPCGTRLSSLLSSPSFAEEGGQGELVLTIWSRPGGGECLPLGEGSGEAGDLC